MKSQGRKVWLLTVYRGNIIKKTVIFLKSSESYCVIGRCNELVLIKRNVRRSSGDYQTQMMLCNPSIRKSLLIPRYPIGGFMYVLGFAPHSKDYKIVAISAGRNLDEEPTKASIAVYTLSDQQWSIRNNVVDISCWDIVKHGFSYIAPVVFYFEGAAHWFGKARLVSLNFDSEKFTFMKIPKALNKRERNRYLFLLGDSLAIFSISKERPEIWVMEKGQGNGGVWTKWFSGRSDTDAFYLFNYEWAWSPSKFKYNLL
ncbi:uncharacterized protein LOC141587148 [Silene latifolia]|uniref:uncharacterized protein LOC141587148 n=1 Tax=Silene latifolia TaxID=37657 RepID=UPI003D7710D5